MSEEAAPAKTGETKGAMYHCDYCRKDITNIVRIKCAECADFDLCLECFAAGVQVSPHRNDHPYRVMDHVTTPIFEWDWGTDEELLLLEAIEMFGLGNWSDVADHVGSKDKIKCEEHYHNVYLNGPTGPLPDISQPLPTKESAAETEEEKKSGLKRSKSKNALVPTTTPATPSTPGQQTQVKKHQIARPKPKSGLGHLVGWIPARGDFETEYDNDAELILADMEFKEEDTRWERELKLKVLDIYNSKLDARAERKKFILERGLLERKEKKRTKEEREVYNNMRVFARFHSQEEHEQFVQGLINEQRLRKRIEQLQQWRLNGIKTLADGEAFEAEKKKREASAQSRKAKESFMYDSRTSSSLLPPSGRKRGAADELGDPSKRGRTDLISPSAASITSLPEYTPPIRPAFDISTLEGYDLLSIEERRICTELQLIPQHYFVIKERLIRESLARGFIKDTTARQLIKIDVNKTAALFDFFVSTGWVNTQAELAPPPGYGVKKEGQQPQGKRPALTNLTATIPNTSASTSSPAPTTSTSTAPTITTTPTTTTGT